MKFVALVVVVSVLSACSENEPIQKTLFENVTNAAGITFSNQLRVTKHLNPYTYRNFYNGAGVAVGDINNDGLDDIYFAGNQTDNKLYLNLSGFRFKDITDQAGVSCKGSWTTGVTFVDINSDGFLDIYVCKSGDPNTTNRHNELFINNGDLTFTERAQEFGLAVIGLSVQAGFFDYDRDGDLDCYLLTNSFKSVGNFDLVKDQRKIPDPTGGGNKLFRNEGGRFRDVTSESGILSSTIGFGLGITFGDFNNDQWTDIFVSNDFFERDYLYINNQNGTFSESLPDFFESISLGSMGADYADLDNDAIPELFVTEMLPDSLHRKKTKTVYENWNKYMMNVENGYHHQFSRNVLQKKVGDHYLEIGRLAGVAASEWSWGALLFDMDNDGLRDIFIATGIYKDLLDRDYLAYSASDNNVRSIIKAENDEAILKILDQMPATPVPNYAFANKGDLKFENMSAAWGLDELTYSSGSAYGDFDNDGDLDLAVNNLNAPASLLRNNSDTTNHSISLMLQMNGANRFAIGAEAFVYADDKILRADNFVTRGFQSSVSSRITIGLGSNTVVVDSLIVKWPDGNFTITKNLAADKLHIIVKDEAPSTQPPVTEKTALLPFHLDKISLSLFRHQGSGLIDFNRDRLLPIMYGNETPSFAVGDLDGDNAADIFVAGGKGQTGVIITKKKADFYSRKFLSIQDFDLSEKTKCLFEDLDNDGDLDLYLATGGRFFPKTSSALMDYVLLNDGKGNFSVAPKSLPFNRFFSTSVVKAIDFDSDGDRDLIVGVRFDPFSYGAGGGAYLLENDGSGNMQDVTEKFAPLLSDIGMVTDIEVCDFNGDKKPDLVIAGDWMPLKFLRNQGTFVDISDDLGLQATRGWWHDIETGDFNRDGILDFVVANHGLNSFFKEGDRLYLSDFDGNGSIEHLYCTRVGDQYYPLADKDDLLSQLPGLKKTLLYYKDYGKKTIDDLIGTDPLKKVRILQTDIMASVLLLSEGSRYSVVNMPREAQYAPLFALSVGDFDQDGLEDVIAGGNQFEVKPQFGRFDASRGWFFRGSLKNGKFELQPGITLDVPGQIRDIEVVHFDNEKYLLFAKHNDEIEVYKVQR